MISENKKKDYIKKVLNSKTFAKSSNNSALLQFLGKKSIENLEIKESIIGVEHFGKSFDIEKNSARVRVNVYNLRQKLLKYYETEGQKDSVVLGIPKGQYNLEFHERKHTSQKKRIAKAKRYSPWIITAIAVAFVIFQQTSSPVVKDIPFWHAFFENEKQTSVYVGDVFSFRGNTEFGTNNVIRDFRFNNSQEFYSYMEAHPEISGHYRPNHFTYLTYMGPASVNRFSNLFSGYGKELKIHLSTKSDYQDIKSNNCIYVGPLNNKNRFVSLFNQQSEHIKIELNQIVRYNELGEQIQSYFGIGEDVTTDYTLVSRIPGPDNTEEFLFFASHDIGIVGVLDYFTNRDSLNNLQQKLPEGNDYFSAIFKTSGLERTSLKSEMLYLESLNGNYK